MSDNAQKSDLFLSFLARTADVRGAYLIIGLDAEEKESFARACACSLNCAAHIAGGCGSCPTCQNIDKQQHPDIVWVYPEGASALVKIGAMRKLIGAVNLRAYDVGFKVGIISGADGMTEEAANCFLKTLEEPPGKTLFLLLCENVQRILPTIRSRCKMIRLADDDPFAGIVPLAAGTRELFFSDFDQVDIDRETMVQMTGELLGWFRDVMVIQCDDTSTDIINMGQRSELCAAASNMCRDDVLEMLSRLSSLRVTLRENYINAKLAFYELKTNAMKGCGIYDQMC